LKQPVKRPSADVFVATFGGDRLRSDCSKIDGLSGWVDDCGRVEFALASKLLDLVLGPLNAGIRVDRIQNVVLGQRPNFDKN